MCLLNYAAVQLGSKSGVQFVGKLIHRLKKGVGIIFKTICKKNPRQVRDKSTSYKSRKFFDVNKLSPVNLAVSQCQSVHKIFRFAARSTLEPQAVLDNVFHLGMIQAVHDSSNEESLAINPGKISFINLKPGLQKCSKILTLNFL